MNPASGSALSGNALTFAHISDLHLPFAPRLSFAQRFSKRQLSVWSWQKQRRAVQRPEILAALQADLAARRPDHVVVTGDVTNFSLPDEFRQAADWFRALCPAQCLSVVPGNHDALVPVAAAQGMGQWAAWTSGGTQWPYVHRRGAVSFIGLCSAVPTAPLRASGTLGATQLQRLEVVLGEEARAGRLRVLMLHHPVADDAAGWRKALTDRRSLRDVVQRVGAELVLHGHARDARLEALSGPGGPIPCLCVPSSTALPNPRDAAARWHLLRLPAAGAMRWAQVHVRQWSLKAAAFIDVASYELRLPDVK